MLHHTTLPSIHATLVNTSKSVHSGRSVARMLSYTFVYVPGFINVS